MNLRIQLAAALLALTLGGWECSAISGGGAMSNGSVGGARVVASAPAVVGIDWPEGGAYGTLEILIEPAKETAFADNDPMDELTNFGALTMSMTQGTVARQPQFQLPCDVGPASSCMYHDGGDFLADSGVRTTLKFLHDGTGATCYHVREISSASANNGFLFGTHNSGTAVGTRFAHGTSPSWRWITLVGNGSASIVASQPTSGTHGADFTAVAWFTHSNARDPDFAWGARGFTSGGSINYAAAVSTSDPSAAFATGSAPNFTFASTQYVFAIACYSSIHSSTETAGVMDAIEAELGVFPL